MTKGQTKALDFFLLSTEQLMKASLLLLHVLLVGLAVPVMLGKTSPDAVSMYKETLAAIIWNLGVLGANKAAQKVANRWGVREDEK